MQRKQNRLRKKPFTIKDYKNLTHFKTIRLALTEVLLNILTLFSLLDYIFLCLSISCNLSSSSSFRLAESSSFLFTMDLPNLSTLGERVLLLEYRFFLLGDLERRRGERSRLFFEEDGVELGDLLRVFRR